MKMKLMVSEKAEEESRVLEGKKQRKNDKSKVVFSRGDIVWARTFPQTWRPGLILKRNRLGVLVWLFDCQTPRHLSDSDICSFDNNFKSLYRTVECGSSSSMSLDRALILLGRRASLSLMCPCQMPIEQRNLRDVGWNSVEQVAEVSNSFQPVAVLGFVVSMAVCPWVEDADIIHAVRGAAQIMTFRRYFSIQKGLIHQEAISPCKSRSTNDDSKAIMASSKSKLQSYSSFGEERYSVIQESDVLEVEDIYQVAQCDTVSESSTSMEENSKSVGGNHVVLNSEIKKQDRDDVALAHREYNIHCSLASPNLFFSEKLNSMPADVVNYNTNSILLRRQSGEFQYSVSSPLKPQISSRTQKGFAKQSEAQSHHEMLVNLYCLALDPFYLGGENLNTIAQNFLNFRVRSYQSIPDLPPKKCPPCTTTIAQFSHSEYDYSFKTQLSNKVDKKICSGETFGSLFPSIEMGAHRLKRWLDQPAVFDPLKLRKTMPFFSRFGTYPQKNITLCDAKVSDVFFLESLRKLTMLNHQSTGSQNLTFICTNSSMLDVVQNNVSLVKDTSHCSEIVEIGMVQVREGNASILNDTRTCISYDYDASDKITNRVRTEDVQADCRFSLLQPASIESVFKNATGTHADKIADASVATRKCRLLSHFSVDLIKIQPSSNDSDTSHTRDREASMRIAYEDSFKDNEEPHQPITSDLSFKSQVDQQSRMESSFVGPTSLHMKFPKDFDLPSKDELVKKFSPFGSVDYRKSKMFFLTGAAQVIFLHRLDAVTAYQYAKRKKILFGQANIRFWLDPFEHSREGVSLATPPICNLKSCLKKSFPLGKEDNKEPHQPITSDLSFKSQVALESRMESSFVGPTSLHMKFPKNFDLPSKDELVKKFTRFGSVDSRKSKIFFYAGSAQVVFLSRLDAVTAYKYAKRKKVLFGQANVRFWLDPFEHSRKGVSQTTPPTCNLKSCLKKSFPLGKEDRKKSHRVRFSLVS
ncbi:hypothetical protein L1049_012046 [Liquidambar formosana]|uniref:PWWP domain-containing protein n=1 Tax=Liquidambar formosana TaxID=63359 RepID=A0AAP0X2W1_LIQFO